MEAEVSRVLIACSQPLFRQGLIGVLRERWPAWYFLDGDSRGQVADEAVNGMRPNLLILELDLPDRLGVNQLQAKCAELPVMVLGETSHSDIVWQCIAMGARAYVCKSAPPAQFVRAVEAILADGVFIPAAPEGMRIRIPVPANICPPCTPDHNEAVTTAFTGRQQEVFLLLAEGCSTKSIARRLGLSVGTVKVHLAGVYRVLGAHSRIEALAKARKLGSHAVSPLEQLHSGSPVPSCFELN